MAALMGAPTLVVEEDGRRRVTEEGPGVPPLVVGLQALRLTPDDGLSRGCGPRAQESGADADDDGGRRDLVVDAHLATTTTTTTMLQQREKRLVLVLDLDHTLLHTIGVHRLAPREAYLLLPEPPRPRPVLDGRHPLPPPGGGGGGDGDGQMLLFLQDIPGYITKLRPFVRTFLREASAMYHLCICTMGIRTYAHEVARILDPDGVYFAPGDIVSRLDFTDKHKKGLDVVRHGDERTTIILDDTPEVWDRHLPNLVQVPEYHYFADTQRSLGFTGPSWAEMGGDEDEAGGALAGALHFLRWIHRTFFDQEAGCGGGDPATRDVRDILRRGLTRRNPAPSSSSSSESSKVIRGISGLHWRQHVDATSRRESTQRAMREVIAELRERAGWWASSDESTLVISDHDAHHLDAFAHAYPNWNLHSTVLFFLTETERMPAQKLQTGGVLVPCS